MNEVTVSFQAAAKLDSFCSFSNALRGKRCKFFRCKGADDADIGGIFQPHTAAKIGRAVCAVVATKATIVGSNLAISQSPGSNS